eukprot:gene2172-1341_t
MGVFRWMSSTRTAYLCQETRPGILLLPYPLAGTPPAVDHNRRGGLREKKEKEGVSVLMEPSPGMIANDPRLLGEEREPQIKNSSEICVKEAKSHNKTRGNDNNNNNNSKCCFSQNTRSKIETRLSLSMPSPTVLSDRIAFEKGREKRPSRLRSKLKQTQQQYGPHHQSKRKRSERHK